MSGEREMGCDNLSFDERRLEERRTSADRRMSILEYLPFDMSFEVERRLRERRMRERRRRWLDN